MHTGWYAGIPLSVLGGFGALLSSWHEEEERTFRLGRKVRNGWCPDARVAGTIGFFLGIATTVILFAVVRYATRYGERSQSVNKIRSAHSRARVSYAHAAHARLSREPSSCEGSSSNSDDTSRAFVYLVDFQWRGGNPGGGVESSLGLSTHPVGRPRTRHGARGWGPPSSH